MKNKYKQGKYEIPSRSNRKGTSIRKENNEFNTLKIHQEKKMSE